uniref:Uncharacterized protein n=1 Tax=Arundo donax TaxID=35708 RepID=A0A0A9GY00_ARUDO
MSFGRGGSARRTRGRRREVSPSCSTPDPPRRGSTHPGPRCHPWLRLLRPPWLPLRRLTSSCARRAACPGTRDGTVPPSARGSARDRCRAGITYPPAPPSPSYIHLSRRSAQELKGQKWRGRQWRTWQLAIGVICSDH